MKQHYVCRIIKGKTYCCLDTGCENFDRAALNREIVNEKKFISGYLQIEEAVSKTPLGQGLPYWISCGELPVVSKSIWRNFSGGHIEDTDEEFRKVVVGGLTKGLVEGI